VIRKRLGRLATVITAGSMALLLLGVGAATAKNPSWTIDVTRLPVSVAAGNDAGYFVTLANAGTSNINAATLRVTTSDTPDATPTYFSGLTWNTGGPELSCSPSGALVCDLGTLAAGTTITFTVAYHVPSGTTGSFDVVFSLESASGNTGSDRGGNSRGDRLNVGASTGISSNQNFDGGFVVGETTYQTNQSVGRRNPQASTVENTASLIPVTVEDGITSGVPCTVGACSNAFGEWTALNVNDGHTYATPFKVTILIWGNAVPGGVQPGDIVLLHTLDDGTTEVIDTPCSPSTGTPTNPECLTVTKVGNNYQIVAWVFKNGNMRGSY
jgi:hypothetical protein